MDTENKDSLTNTTTQDRHNTTGAHNLGKSLRPTKSLVPSKSWRRCNISSNVPMMRIHNTTEDKE